MPLTCLSPLQFIERGILPEKCVTICVNGIIPEKCVTICVNGIILEKFVAYLLMVSYHRSV